MTITTDSLFLRTASTPGRKPTLPDTPKVLSRRAQKRNSYNKNKHKYQKRKKMQVEKSTPVCISAVPTSFVLPNKTSSLEQSNDIEIKDYQTRDITPFRISAKRFLLTYSRIANDVTLQEFLTALKAKPTFADAEIYASQ